MSEKRLRISAALRRLEALIDEERIEIGRRSIEKIARLAPRKEQLLAEFDAAALAADVASAAGDLAQELERVRGKAARNCRLLAALKQGAADARARIERLQRDGASAGLYLRDGEKVAAPACTTIARSA